MGRRPGVKMQRRRGHVRLDPGGQDRAGTNRQVVEGKKLLALVKQVIASRSKRASSTSSSSLIAQLKCVQHQKWLQSKTDKKTRRSSMSALVNPIRVSASKTRRWVLVDNDGDKNQDLQQPVLCKNQPH